MSVLRYINANIYIRLIAPVHKLHLHGPRVLQKAGWAHVVILSGIGNECGTAMICLYIV
jgi:hypothetical protein